MRYDSGAIGLWGYSDWFTPDVPRVYPVIQAVILGTWLNTITPNTIFLIKDPLVHLEICFYPSYAGTPKYVSSIHDILYVHTRRPTWPWLCVYIHIVWSLSRKKNSIITGLVTSSPCRLIKSPIIQVQNNNPREKKRENLMFLTDQQTNCSQSTSFFSTIPGSSV